MTIDAHVEMFYGSAWQDITADVDMRSSITIDYGESDEHGEATPTSCSLRLDNRAAKFSPLDPNSALYGKIGRGTKLRTRIGTKDASLAMPGVDGSYASTPDVAALDITGDIDIRIDVDPHVWYPDSPLVNLLASKYQIDGDNRSWIFYVISTGALRFAWSPDGTLASRVVVTSTASVPNDGARRAVRVTFDVDNGASGNEATFYTAPSIAGPWTQLGAVVTTAGVTSIFSGGSPVEIGAGDGGVDPLTVDKPFGGTVYAFELRDGIGGTVVANPDFTAPDAGDTSLTDASGLVWTVHGGAAIVDPSLRASGAIGSFKPAWDETTLDAQMSVEAAGILRRLGQGQETLRSAMYRGMTGGNVTTPRAYWPCEDGDKTSAIGSALSGHPPMRISGDVTLAAHGDLDASEPIPTFGTGYVQGAVPGYTTTNFMRCMALVAIPDSITGEPNVLYLTTTGSINRWYLSIDSGGDLRIRARRRDDDVEILNSLVDFNILGKSGLIWIYLTKTGPTSIDYQIGFAGIDSTAPGVAGGTVTGFIGSATRVISGGLGGDLGGMAVGHITVLDTDEFWSINQFAKAWTGETAVDRITRLCAEENVPLRLIGTAEDSQLVGPQRVGTFLDLVEDAAAVAGGRFGERRDADGLLYRSRSDLYNQAPALTLDMDDGHIINPFDPPLDDQTVRNDVTVTRERGSSARAVQETGPLSIQDPPDGVGRYTTSETLNLHADGLLANQATWRLHLGTVDEHRIASLEIEMEHHPGLEQAVKDLEAGDLIRISNPPPGLPPGPLDLIALGWTDVIGDDGQTWHVTINCAPGSPWTVAVADDAELGRADTAGSVLAADAAAADTTLKVLTTLGPLWIEDAAEFPFDVRLGGEVVTVSDIDPLVLDTFTRSVASGWGAADSGQGWTLAGGAASDYSVNGTRGVVSLGSVATSRRTILPESQRDVDLTASVATDKVATGNWITASLAARRSGSANFYEVRVEFKHDGNVGINLYKTVIGTPTTLTAGHVLGTYAANERFNVRFAVIESALGAKIWRVGSPEPEWQLFTTDTDLTTAENIATHSELLSGNTNTLPVTISWDDLTSKAQKFTVTRSANGISKAQTAGTDVALAQPAIAAL